MLAQSIESQIRQVPTLIIWVQETSLYLNFNTLMEEDKIPIFSMPV